MLKKISLYSAIALTMAAFAPAQAADMPMKAPAYKAAPIVAPPSWTGFYIGIHGGAGWGTVESDINLGGLGLGTFPISSHTINGPLFGGQIGYNYQMNWAVIGIEATGAWADIKGDTPCLFGIATCTTKSDWLATAAVRLGGVVGGNTLVFVKGGAAWIHDNYSASILGLATINADETRVGWLGGLGAEYKFDARWSGVIEYNYMDFGKDTVSFGVLTGAGFPGIDISHTQHVVKAGLNFKLF